VERCPVDTAVVAFQDVFNDGIGIAEQIGLALVGTGDLFLERHGRLVRLVLLAQARDIPNSNGQVHRRGHDEIVPRVELGTPGR